MKKFLFAAFLMVSIVACKKGGSISPALFGKWEVTRTYGGFIIPPDSTYKPGNGNILQFNADSTYARFAKGQQTGQGVFHIIKNGFKNNQTSYDEIYFDGDSSFRSIITLNNDLLTLKPLIPDISATDYQKIQN
ncbi:MAG: hypothetical protein ACHQIM_21160 [Sphingobacteriales bacterium]